MFLICISTVNAVLAFRVPKFWGKENLDEGMLSTEGMAPMGAGLQEPVVICLPLVMGKLGTVRQKLIKLLLDVKDFTCPAAGTSWPSFSNPVASTRGSMAI